MKIFEPIDVHLDKLLLDPNNPRLMLEVDSGEIVEDDSVESLQEQVLARFSKSSSLDESMIDISDLDSSMRKLGYIGIDKIVVRALENSNKFVVVEGNRRVAAMRKLVAEFQEHGERNSLTQKKIDSFKDLGVMELGTEGLSAETIEERISVILGLRHHGSLLEWEPLPKAHNIFIHYMEFQDGPRSFEWNPEYGREVASVLSIKLAEVRKSLLAYISYCQLKERYAIDTRYYSLIEAAVTNRHLVGHRYFGYDERSFRLDQGSFDRLVKICQFENRSSLESKQIVISKPQLFGQLGQIVERVYRAQQQAVRILAAALLSDVEEAELDPEKEYALKVTVTQAWLDLKAFEEGVEWVVTLNKLIDEQADKLKLADYFVEGNDRRAKDELTNLLGRFQAIVNLN